MESELVEALEAVSKDATDDVARELREEVVGTLENADQGADGLVPYVTEIEEDTNGEASFSIEHPTAPLHEIGGHIEPRYARAMAVGWTRDGFYEALTDCNEWVIEKRFMRNSVWEVRKRLGD